MKRLVIALPNPKQELFFKSTKRFIGYGGARGGGKSWAMRTKLILLALHYNRLNLLLLRKTLPELRENHILPMLAQLNGIAKYSKDERAFTFPNGSRIRMGYCDTETDIYQYQGQEYDAEYDSSGTWELLDESGAQKTHGFTIKANIPRRCDHMRLKIEGRGKCTIYSISLTVQEGSDL